MTFHEPVLIEVALNGGWDRTACAAIPYTTAEIAAARRCAAEGATLFHVPLARTMLESTAVGAFGCGMGMPSACRLAAGC